MHHSTSSRLSRQRARVRVLALSQRETTASWLLPLATGALLLAALVAAHAQDATPAPPNTIPPPASQGTQPETSPNSSAANPSAALSQSGGVIKPPTNVDPAIGTKPPASAAQLPTPVLKPPATTNNGSTIIQPK